MHRVGPLLIIMPNSMTMPSLPTWHKNLSCWVFITFQGQLFVLNLDTISLPTLYTMCLWPFHTAQDSQFKMPALNSWS